MKKGVNVFFFSNLLSVSVTLIEYDSRFSCMCGCVPLNQLLAFKLTGRAVSIVLSGTLACWSKEEMVQIELLHLYACFVFVMTWRRRLTLNCWADDQISAYSNRWDCLIFGMNMHIKWAQSTPSWWKLHYKFYFMCAMGKVNSSHLSTRVPV